MTKKQKLELAWIGKENLPKAPPKLGQQELFSPVSREGAKTRRQEEG